MRTPVSTYRLQIRPSFTLQDAAKLTGYLHNLGIDWVYVSPILTAEEGSDHGYDVTDPSTVDPSRGGPEGLAALSKAAREQARCPGGHRAQPHGCRNTGTEPLVVGPAQGRP